MGIISGLGIICGLICGSFAVLGSLAGPYRNLINGNWSVHGFASFIVYEYGAPLRGPLGHPAPLSIWYTRGATLASRHVFVCKKKILKFAIPYFDEVTTDTLHITRHDQAVRYNFLSTKKDLSLLIY